jgi:dipeptidyl aminopeptidase/acylaminoacyl peptidase
MMKTSAKFTIAALLLLIIPLSLDAQDNPDFNESYLTPPQSIAEEVLAPRHENVTLSNLSPGGDYFLNRVGSGISPLSAYAKPYYNIAGLQIDHIGNRHRSLTTQNPTVGLELINPADGSVVREIEVPRGVTITQTAWSPDGSKLAWMGHSRNASHLYVSDLSNGSTQRVTERALLATMHTSVEWSGDSRHLFAVTLPENRGQKPVKPQTPNTLQVKVTSEGENRLRTFPSLIEGRHEEKLLEYYITGQLVKIDTETGVNTPVGEPAMIRSVDASPDGEYVLVQTVQTPFSNVVPLSWFGWYEVIWDLEGNTLATVRTSEARMGIPDQEPVEDYGRSQVQWRPDGNGLSLLYEHKEEENGDDDGNNNGNSSTTYRVMQWLPPFSDDDKQTVYEADRQIHSVSYSDNAEILFLTQRRAGAEHLFAWFADKPDSTYTIYRYQRDDFYANPGNLMHRSGEMGVNAVRLSPNREYVYLSGTEYDENPLEQSPRPFIDRVEIETGEKERIFQSAEDRFERVLAIMDDSIERIVIERESADILPDSWIYHTANGNAVQLTSNVDYNEAVAQAIRERFKVKRADGFEFWVEVVLPANWNGERLPGFLWHYPREFDDQESYNEGLRTFNKNQYPRVGVRTPAIMVKEGYAVILPDWPIAGDRGTSNDAFVWSIVQNSTAVIDSVDARGYVDRHRMAMGGHSYGAFGTVNAMIHTSFFKAGIAGAGNFNRTLTPIGFQRERADIWRGMDRYVQMSPIFWADRMDGALLMYHGADDQNVGTFPINSERMFHALNGLDKTAVLYMYPYEGHGPAARETLLDMWTRWVDWLDYYLK